MESPLKITQINIPAGFIDLGLGDPQFSLLPLDLLHRAAEEQFKENNPDFLQYGAEQGNGTFLQSLAEFLSRGYTTPVKTDNLFITSGASMGLHLICTFFTRPGDTVFVEEPTYFLALRIFADHELRLVPIHTDENGLVIESLEEQLMISRPKFLYVIPTYQNPTGQTLSQERRERLINLSRQHNFLVVADEVYHFLSYFNPPPKPFAAEIGAGNIISLGSFSKIMAPGLRLGWIQANPEIIHRFINSGLLDSGGGMNPFTSSIMNCILGNGALDQNIAKLISIYRARIEGMDAALQRYLPGVEYTLPKGGYFFWTHLPKGMNAIELQRRAETFKVRFRPGTLFSSQGGMQDYMRLCFVFYDVNELEQGIQRLKQGLKKMDY